MVELLPRKLPVLSCEIVPKGSPKNIAYMTGNIHWEALDGWSYLDRLVHSAV
jgi:hypothetical protein